MPKVVKEEIKEEKVEVKAVPESGKLRPIEWASQKGIGNVAIAGAFVGDDKLMDEAEFDKKLKEFMNKPASY